MQNELPLDPSFNYKLIAEGTYQIYRVTKHGEPEERNPVVLKCRKHANGCHDLQCKALLREYNLTKTLEHPYIMQTIKFQKVVTQDTTHCLIQMKSYPQDLYKYIQAEFPKVNARFFVLMFYRVVKAVEYLHKQGICHFDIKPENIAISYENEPKLIDFGLSLDLKGIDEKEVVRVWRNRNPQYLSPEAIKLVASINEQTLKPKDYQGMNWKAIDVFQLGVTMFSCFFFIYPFASQVASVEDEFYRLLCEKKYEEFWQHDKQLHHYHKVIESQIGGEALSLLEKLMQDMLAYNPKERPDIKSVKSVLKEIARKVE